MIYILSFALFIVLVSCKEKFKQATSDPGIFYTCSMHPQVMQPVPGKCPICQMELIPVKKNDAQTADVITLSDQQIQLGNIRVDTIGKGSMEDQTVLTATINIDETGSAAVSARISGRIDKLYFKSEGDYISKGQKLYDLYSEELNNAKQEYILALEKQTVLDNSIIDFTQLVQSAKNKLLLWGMSEAQITELAKTKKAPILTSFYSTAGGYITDLKSHEGDYVSEGTVIVRLADLSTLWAEAQVYASRLSTIDRNAIATVQLPELGKEITGHIQFINPEIDPGTRINLIRVSIPNPGRQVKPGMPAYVVLKNRQTNSISLPADAVIRNEKHSTVWVQAGKNSFKNVMVVTGLENEDRIEIRQGLKEGDIVVTSGAYLINSEYIFKNGANPMAGHDMKNM